MQLPEPPPPPLAPLWDRVLRARALPPDLDVQLLYIAIRDRLTHAEWEVRLHALRVLADLLPLSGNALSFPFDQVVDNLGHGSPNVRKAALDALKVFCTHCEDPECAVRAIVDKCYYHNIRPHSANNDTKINVITGLVLSLPSIMTILKRRHPALNMYPIFQILGEKLFDHVHRDVALRSLLKFRKVCGTRDFSNYMSKLDQHIQDKFRFLCENYDEDSLDVYYAPRKSYHEGNNQQLVRFNHVFNIPTATSSPFSNESLTEDSFRHAPYCNNNFGKVIIETEIKFDSETAITMTVLEENDSESDKYEISEEDYDSSDRNMLKYSEGESDADVVVKKVRFGGESVKIRTPDSDNLLTSEEDNKNTTNPFIEPVNKSSTQKVLTSEEEILHKKSTIPERDRKLKPVKKSGIPLPIIKTKSPKSSATETLSRSNIKMKSKSLSELYDYFRTKNDLPENKTKSDLGFALTLAEVRSPEKIPSPVESHREVEVLHNLQRSPVVSPRRRRETRIHLEHNGFTLKLLASSITNEQDFLSPRPPTPLQEHYEWEELGMVPRYVTEQLHNTENWIAAVKAADQLHSALLNTDNVKMLEPAALSFIQHMWALGDAVSAARAPTESAVCALVRGASNNCARQILPNLIARMCREPSPAALPHALLQRLALHHIVDLIFDPTMTGELDPDRIEGAQLRGTLCLARAAGPAAVLSAVRRRLANSARADAFCNKLRERLNRPSGNIRPSNMGRSSQLPVAVRRRARSTPPPAPPVPPRRLRPLPDSAPLLGISTGRDLLMNKFPLPLTDRESSAFTKSCEDKEEQKDDDSDKKNIRENDTLFEDATIITPTEIITNDTSPLPVTPSRSPARSPARSPSIHIEDYSAKSKSNPSINTIESQETKETQSHKSKCSSLEEIRSSRSSLKVDDIQGHVSRSESRRSTPSRASRAQSRSRSTPSSPSRSAYLSPEPTSAGYEASPPPVVRRERDVRSALAECTVPAKHDDWEVIVNGLLEIERLAADECARAPAASWRSAARSTAAHVRSLRSRVARAACCTLGALFEHRGRALDPELEESAAALLERCADVNRFLRADAAAALVRLACGGGGARAAVALARRGAAHRAGPVRATAAQALASFVHYSGADRVLNMSPEPRTLLLRAAGDLLGDAHAETRLHARHLCVALAEDDRFESLLKASMPPSKYRAIEKFVDKLRCR